uniref:Uncharacterized protein n=1 Tax=viral metagenome TaxID=1070528 RepID=A0A6C0JG16_9ZZZZ
MSTDFVKQTLRENLGRTLVPHVADGFWSIYDNARSACERNKQPDQVLRTFQNLLTQVPKWSTETLKKEVDRISAASKCDYIEDLLLGVFVSYIRAFASLQQTQSEHVDIPFTRPAVEVFVHKFYVVAARGFWSNAYLFRTVGITSEQQARNRRDIEVMLADTLNEVIDSFIPWKDISKAYFKSPEAPEPLAALAAPAAVVEAPVPVAPAPALVEEPPKPAVKFGKNEVQEADSEDEESESDDDEPPAIQLGEDVGLNDDDFDSETESEGEVDVKPSSEAVALNL